MALRKHIREIVDRTSWMSDGWLDKGSFKYEVLICWSCGPDTIFYCRANSEESAILKAHIWHTLEDGLFSWRMIYNVKVEEIHEKDEQQ